MCDPDLVGLLWNFGLEMNWCSFGLKVEGWIKQIKHPNRYTTMGQIKIDHAILIVYLWLILVKALARKEFCNLEILIFLKNIILIKYCRNSMRNGEL